MNDAKPNVKRHKTAIRRVDASAPVKCGIRDNLITTAESVFDYGCGHGGDLQFLETAGIKCFGWDPAFRPTAELTVADVVNLGFVINVIEDPTERTETLKRAWGLCQKTLIVSAQIVVAGRGNHQVEFGDGILTRRGTFQKFFTQAELRQYVESVLETDAIPAAPGVFYAFKDEQTRQGFLANRYRRRPAGERKRSSEIRFEANKELLKPLVEWVESFGRIPEPDEFELSEQVIGVFSSLKRAFSLARKVIGDEVWQITAAERRADLLVYLALARFRRRPPISQLPLTLQRDIRAFFGSYSQACTEADELLFRAGDADAIDLACKSAMIGKLLPNALYIHRTALESLDPLLRVYEGCGRAFLGEVDGANIVKLHRFSGKVSYLVYPEFDADPHPSLLRSVKLSLRNLTIDCYEYSEVQNPPVLHRKETFLLSSHPLHAKFTKLTKQEERHGLLDETSLIGTKAGWEQRLQEKGMRIRGHRLMKLQDDGT